MDDLWIWVEKWDEFQTFQNKKDRPKPWAPPWIKTYTAQMSDDRYLTLTDRQRSLLHDVRIVFAMTRGRTRYDAPTITRYRHIRTRYDDLEALVLAGFLSVCSGTSLEQKRDKFWNRSTLEVEVEVDVEEEEINPSVLPTSSLDGEGRTEDEIEMRKTEAELADVDRDHYGVPLNGRTPQDDLAAELGLANILKNIP